MPLGAHQIGSSASNWTSEHWGNSGGGGPAHNYQFKTAFNPVPSGWTVRQNALGGAGGGASSNHPGGGGASGAGNGQTPGSGSAAGGIVIQDEGSALSTIATTLDFVGSGVVASGTGATKTITISGGAGGTPEIS